MANAKNQNPGMAPKGRGGTNGFKLVGFPKEFEKSFWDVFDKRFYGILLTTWIILYAFTFYMSTRDWQISDQEMAKIKQNYMQQLYAELVTPDLPTESEGEGGLVTEEEGGGEEEELSETSQKLVSESSSEKVRRRAAGVGARRAKRRQMEQEAAGYGVLAALTAAGGGGSGEAYADILGEAGGGGSGLANAGDLVSGTAALQAATRGGQRSRIAKGGGFGGEVGETGIDDLVSGTGVSEGASVVRRGSIKLAQDTRVTGTGSGSSQRDPEVIDAVINQNKASVEYCYQSQLKVDPTLRGEIMLSFDILASGKVGGVKIMNSSLGNQKVERCIIRSVRRWTFPTLTDGRGIVTIRTKFVFG